MNDSNVDNSKEIWNGLWENYAQMQDAVPANVWRRGLLLRLLNQHVPHIEANKPSQIIDFGCGPGLFLKWLSVFKPNARLLGIDQSDSGLEYARKQIPSADFVAMDLAKAVEPPENFRFWGEAGICSEVLEHVEEPVVFLKNIASWLDDNGILIVTVPGAPAGFAPGMWGHLRHYKADSVQNLLEESGYKIVRIFNAGFPFYNLYQLLVHLGWKKFIKKDTAQGDNYEMSPLIRFASFIFRILMKININFTPWGWQIVAVAKKK